MYLVKDYTSHTGSLETQLFVKIKNFIKTGTWFYNEKLCTRNVSYVMPHKQFKDILFYIV